MTNDDLKTLCNRLPLGVVIDRYLTTHLNNEVSKMVEQLGADLDPNTDEYKLLQKLAANKNAAVYDAVLELVTQTRDGTLNPPRFSEATVLEMAAEYRITNRKIGEWRRRRVCEAVGKGSMTRHQLETAVHLSGEPLTLMLDDLINSGLIRRDGDLYTGPDDNNVGTA